MTVAVASNAAAIADQHRRPSRAAATPAGATATDAIAVAADACPNGWPRDRDEPRGRRRLHAAGRARTPARTRIALTFDDGPSYYRPATLAHLRAKGVPATFFDIGHAAGGQPAARPLPSSPRATRVLGHSYDHPNLNNIPARDARASRSPRPRRASTRSARRTRFKVIRPPFLERQRGDPRRRWRRWASPSRRTRSPPPTGIRRAPRRRSARGSSVRRAPVWRSCSTTGRSTRPPGRRRSTRCR